VLERYDVIRSLPEFADSTTFERWALEALVPLPVTRPHQRVKDPIARHVWVTAGTAIARAYAGGVREVYVDLRPLAFGAAWKVLDLLIELALSNTGAYPNAGQLPIADKQQAARQGQGTCIPLSGDAALWRTLTASYDATTEIRHSLVHRLAEVDKATGTLVGRDRSGQPLLPITADQQEAFCRAVQRAAAAALTGRISPRERSDLTWQLDQLQAHHQQPLLGGQELRPPPLIIAPASMANGHLVVDVPMLRQEAQSSFPEEHQVDATFALPDGRHLIGQVESAPGSVVNVDLNDLPDWLEEWEGRTT
jgi:hypothetical protein